MDILVVAILVLRAVAWRSYAVVSLPQGCKIYELSSPQPVGQCWCLPPPQPGPCPSRSPAPGNYCLGQLCIRDGNFKFSEIISPVLANLMVS